MPAPERTPEHVVSELLAAELIGAQFPELRGAPVELLATGWDNTVHLVGGQWVFRFPRRALALRGLEHEIAVLPRLSSLVPLPIPVPEMVGTPSQNFPWRFWGARLISGRELAETALPEGERVAAAAGLGEFLHALHDPDLTVQVGAELPHDPMQRGNPGVRAPMARQRLARLVEHQLWEPDDAVEQLLAESERLGPSTSAPVVVHGDLHQRHLLLDEDANAVGVIDWGDLCVADPAVDLSLAYSGFAGPARAALLRAYGPVDAERELRARVLAVDLCAVLADYAAVEGRPRLLEEALAGIRRAVAG